MPVCIRKGNVQTEEGKLLIPYQTAPTLWTRLKKEYKNSRRKKGKKKVTERGMSPLLLKAEPTAGTIVDKKKSTEPN